MSLTAYQVALHVVTVRLLCIKDCLGKCIVLKSQTDYCYDSQLAIYCGKLIFADKVGLICLSFPDLITEVILLVALWLFQQERQPSESRSGCRADQTLATGESERH
ncbi:hypothetical protein HNR37_000341 [Desulfurispira natronophila]|uniref:Uncharacterized protein n=1 Tax=Desulfurispira natronophila TaxID=682562 RepID=A0A7W7Y2W8_9BACT|nr:hypothetical protein [Desulfurispira natronophila]